MKASPRPTATVSPGAWPFWRARWDEAAPEAVVVVAPGGGAAVVVVAGWGGDGVIVVGLPPAIVGIFWALFLSLAGQS